MIVTCPACEAKYRVDEAALEARAGRVRCASCGHAWTVGGEALTLNEPAEAPKPPEEPGERVQSRETGFSSRPHAAIRARALTRERRARLAAEGVGWAGVAACFALLLAGAVVFRADIVETWPRAAGAYAAAGVEVNPFGLEVAELTAGFTDGENGPVLVVEGMVRNISSRERPAPALRAVVLDASGVTLAEWPVALEAPSLARGAAQRFQTQLDDPPESAARVEVLLAG